MNREWHLAHSMPPRPTEAQRIEWHLAHAANCDCRAVPDRMLARLRELGIAPPKAAAAPGRTATEGKK